jgi:hypothetical protein
MGILLHYGATTPFLIFSRPTTSRRSSMYRYTGSFLEDFVYTTVVLCTAFYIKISYCRRWKVERNKYQDTEKLVFVELLQDLLHTGPDVDYNEQACLVSFGRLLDRTSELGPLRYAVSQVKGSYLLIPTKSLINQLRSKMNEIYTLTPGQCSKISSSH